MRPSRRRPRRTPRLFRRHERDAGAAARLRPRRLTARTAGLRHAGAASATMAASRSGFPVLSSTSPNASRPRREAKLYSRSTAFWQPRRACRPRLCGGRNAGSDLGVSRAGYGTIDTATETITIDRDWNAPGIKSLAGVLQFRDYGSYIEDLKRGETVIVADATDDPRTTSTARCSESHQRGLFHQHAGNRAPGSRCPALSQPC